MPRIYSQIFIFLLAALLIASCSDTDLLTSQAMHESYEVDPVFREFYDARGGSETLGPAISPLFIFGEYKYQYTIASLMVHDPQAPSHQRIQFAALGLDMNIAEPGVPAPTLPGTRYVDGHIIPEFFLPMYERMGGARHMGKPLTEVHYNPEKRRYEQYFENLGLFLLDGEATGGVGLLAYGAWKCDSSCRHPDLGPSAVILPYKTAEPFAEIVRRLGPDFTGFAISEAYQTPDGYIEQVFANIVLISDPNHSGRVMYRSISDRLGLRPDPLVAASGLPGMVFIPIQGDRGYNVPQHFLDYLAQHGGQEAAGAPIGELIKIKDRINRQCFRNLCLEEHYDDQGRLSVKPAQLGYTYNKLTVVSVNNLVNPVETASQPGSSAEGEQGSAGSTGSEASQQPEQPVSEISVQVWEGSPMVSSSQSQEIGVMVFENKAPKRNVEPDLIVTYPDGSTKTIYMLPTDNEGRTRASIDPISALNGTLIQYEVCIYSVPGRAKYCVADSYMIWQNP